MKERILLAGALLIVVLTFVGYGFGFFDGTSEIQRTLSMEAAEAQWRERIKAVGAAAAHEEFVSFMASLSITRQHRFAHAFGAALYKEEGARGIVICTTAFSFGCLHEFFKLSVAEFGSSALSSMAEDCKESIGIWHPCQHAIGHGILANFGYDETSIKNALEVCRDDYNDDPMNGCYGGVFMEYNLYSSVALAMRPRDPAERWHSPCDALSEEYLASCYFWLPQWWREHLLSEPSIGNEDFIFEKMGNLCREAPIAYQRDCFQRVGQMSVYGASYEPEEMKRLCTRAARSESENLFCRSYAAYILGHTDVSDAKWNALAREVCSDLRSEEKEYCDAYADQKYYTPHDAPLPASVL